MKAELCRNYLSVNHEGRFSYGGNQNWFPGQLKRCGCAVIGAADLIWYLARGSSMSEGKYQKYVRRLSRSFPTIPYRGIPGLVMAVFLNIYMIRKHLPYRAHWGAGRGGISRRVAAMIANDIPVPLCVGPALHQILKKPAYRGLKLYKKTVGTEKAEYVWNKTIRNHFMVITGINETWARVSSWGEAYYIDLKELEEMSVKDVFGAYTNIIRIEQKGGLRNKGRRQGGCCGQL